MRQATRIFMRCTRPRAPPGNGRTARHSLRDSCKERNYDTFFFFLFFFVFVGRSRRFVDLRRALNKSALSPDIIRVQLGQLVELVELERVGLTRESKWPTSLRLLLKKEERGGREGKSSKTSIGAASLFIFIIYNSLGEICKNVCICCTYP